MDLITTHIRDIPDFPKPGIIFKDITPLLLNPDALKLSVERLLEPFEQTQITAVVGMEARGFIFGAIAAQALEVGFIPLRKPGKLPHATTQIDYDLEYGQATLEIHTDAISENDHILVIDDVLATGGTAQATCQLIESLGGHIVGCSFLLELTGLAGRELLSTYPVHSVVKI